ncbi:FecR domain-containing protein [Burkholderia ambifaria]|uniref:FecR domain-containing protein n=1 Tax=Burkholderia ambifaria TaxID=152480 RepID=UPI002FE2AF18
MSHRATLLHAHRVRRSICAAWIALASISILHSPTAIAQEAAIPVSAPLFEYSIRAADTLYDLATQYLNTPSDWTALQRINRVRDPKRLQPGETLRIPVSMLKNSQPTARVIAVTGRAETFGADIAVRTPLHEGAVLKEGDHVKTGERSFVTLELSDGSHIALLPATTVWIKRLRDIGTAHTVERRFEVDNGKIETQVSPLKPHDSYDVTTPSIIAGVRGTAFRVTYVADTRRTVVEVLDGKVRVAGTGLRDGNETALVQRGFGVAAADGHLADLAALLAAPALSRPAQVQDGNDIAFELIPLPQATRYRATIATDAGFLDIVDDARSDAPRITLKNRAPGTYFVRVSAIDANGIEGLSRVYSFTRAGVQTDALARANFEFRWTDEAGMEPGLGWHFTLGQSDRLDEPLVDQHGLVGNRLVLSNLPDGTYYWSVNIEARSDESGLPHRRTVQSFSVGNPQSNE